MTAATAGGVGGGEGPAGSAEEPPLSAVRLETLLVTVDEAARLLCVNRSTIYHLLGCGELASVKIGRRRLVSRHALADFIDRSERR